MPRGGIREKINNISRGPREPCRSVPRGAPSPLFYLRHFFRVVFDSRSSFFAPKPHGNACYAGCGGRRKQCRSVPRGGVRRLWAPGGVKKRKEIGLGPREQCHSVPRCGVKKKDRSRTERAVSLWATGWS